MQVLEQVVVVKSQVVTNLREHNMGVQSQENISILIVYRLSELLFYDWIFLKKSNKLVKRSVMC